MFHIFCFLYFFLVGLTSFEFSYAELKLVNVLFRHGDRTPGHFMKTYSDPNGNRSFYPIGLGDLTNIGKQRVYDFGKRLRTRYDEFLGPFYVKETVEAVSSESSRTRMSLQLLLLSLYPPMKIQRWNEAIDWQPVLTSFQPMINDPVFAPQRCIEFQKELQRIKNSTEFRELTEDLKPMTIELTKDMGRKSLVDVRDMNFLYQTLVAEKGMNLSMPPWTDAILSSSLFQKGVKLFYTMHGYNTKLRRLSGGTILRKIVHDMEIAIDNLSAHKIHVYSGHELNIVMLLQTLGIRYDGVPEFTSSIIFELHEIDDKFYIRILYYYGIPAKFTVVSIPGCSPICPFDKFTKLLSNVIATTADMACERR